VEAPPGFRAADALPRDFKAVGDGEPVEARVLVEAIRAARVVHDLGEGAVVERRAGGAVRANTGAGSVKVRSAASVDVVSGSGQIQLQSVSGGIQAATAMGGIIVELAGKQVQDSLLSTQSGDITVYIPSNAAVTVEAVNASRKNGRTERSSQATSRPR
jgi:hypothetical protein